MTEKEFQEEFNSLKGQFVIYHGVVYHFVGIGEDDHDFFYILLSSGKEGIMLGSPISLLIKLKGKIEQNDYNWIINHAKRNHPYCEEFYLNKKIDNFNAEKGKEYIIDKIKEYDKNKIIDIYWNFE